jgi:hypothetical protein
MRDVTPPFTVRICKKYTRYSDSIFHPVFDALEEYEKVMPPRGEKKVVLTGKIIPFSGKSFHYRQSH